MSLIRKLTPTGGKSGYVIIPKQFLDALGWRKKQRLVVSKQKGAIVIRDAKTKKRK